MNYFVLGELVVCLIMILIFLPLIVEEIIKYSNFKYLSKNDLISKNIRFEDFKDMYSIIQTGFNMSGFKIVYFKDSKVILKIKSNYFILDDSGSLIYVFNENEYIVKKFKSTKKV